MWENTAPLDHWKFWAHLDVKLCTGAGFVKGAGYRVKTGYNIAGFYEYVGARMLLKGRMGKAMASLGLVEITRRQCDAAEYMPATFEEWKTMKETGKWKYDHVAKYMDEIDEYIAAAYYATTYEMKDMRKDVSIIKATMKTALR